MKKKLLTLIGSICLIAVLAALPFLTACPAPAEEEEEEEPTAWEMPKFIPLVSAGTSGSGFAAGTGALSAIEEATGVSLTLTPAAKTVGRAMLLKKGKVDFGLLTAIDVFYGLEGLGEFDESTGALQWGPQPYRAVYVCGPIDQGLATRDNSGIRTWADLEGKRVATYPTYPTVQLYMDGGLAYGDLSWDDVIPTPVAGWGAGGRAVLEGAVDVAAISGTSAIAFELEASVYGIHWLPMPNETAEDKAAWARLHELNFAFYPRTTSIVAGSSADNPVHIWGYNYHFICYEHMNENLSYWLTKQLCENYDGYKDKHAYLKKWTVEQCLTVDQWFCPWHKGSIQYFKDAGLWTDEMEAKQQELLAKYPLTQ